METQQVSEKFSKREFIVEYATNPEYPEQIKFQLNNKNIELINQYSVGDEIEVHFNLTGKPWTNKDGVTTYFNNLVAWKIVMIEANTNPPKQESTATQPETETNDDLPF
ncbi:MAG: DUF3127 domain-containing protein [Ignavibacteria bacterium]|nr:DUF3127 domain-containing protein [Ignavibacteria bacterium]